MTKQHSLNSVAAKARNRLASPPPEYFDAPDTTKPVRRIIYDDLLTKQTHEFLCYISPSRVDQFRVMVNGKLWLERAGWSRICAGLRKAAGRFGRLAV